MTGGLEGEGQIADRSAERHRKFSLSCLPQASYLVESVKSRGRASLAPDLRTIARHVGIDGFGVASCATLIQVRNEQMLQITSADVVAEPFPHVLKQGILPEDLFQKLKADFPDGGVFKDQAGAHGNVGSRTGSGY